MLYNVNEKFGHSVMFGDDALALMVTEDDVRYIIGKGLPYAIEHKYGVFKDKNGKVLTEKDVTEEIIHDGFYTGEHTSPNTLDVIMEDVLGYVLFHQDLLLVPDDEHMPKETKPGVIYTMVNMKELTERKAAEILEMSV